MNREEQQITDLLVSVLEANQYIEEQIQENNTESIEFLFEDIRDALRLINQKVYFTDSAGASEAAKLAEGYY